MESPRRWFCHRPANTDILVNQILQARTGLTRNTRKISPRSCGRRNIMVETQKLYKLIDENGEAYLSRGKERSAVTEKTKSIAWVLASMSQYIACGKYGERVYQHRVFFANRATAVAAGFAQGNCMRERCRLERRKNHPRQS